MAAITKLSDLEILQFNTSGVPIRLSEPSGKGSTSFKLDNPVYLEDGVSLVTKEVIVTFITPQNKYLTVYLPAGSFTDAQTISNAGIKRGLLRGGLDITAIDTSYDIPLPQGSEIVKPVTTIEIEQLKECFFGNIASGANILRIGDETDSDITIYAQNADANKPFFRYDKTTNQFVFSNDGISSTPFGTGAGVTGGDGITVTAGDIDIDVTDTIIFKQTSAGVGDAGKIPRFNASGLINQSIVENWKDVTATPTEINQSLDGISANVTFTNLNTLTGGLNANVLHFHGKKIIRTTRTMDAASGTVNIAHGLGTAPRYALVFAKTQTVVSGGLAAGSVVNVAIGSEGWTDGSTDAGCTATTRNSADSDQEMAITSFGQPRCIHVQDTYNDGTLKSRIQQASITFDATNVNIVWTKEDNGSPSTTETIQILIVLFQ